MVCLEPMPPIKMGQSLGSPGLERISRDDLLDLSTYGRDVVVDVGGPLGDGIFFQLMVKRVERVNLLW
jgi:hypothetical protein